jgi:hypothetical protein
VEDKVTNRERFGDSVAWGGCTIVYLLGQHLRFELLDFVYHSLNVAEVEVVSSLKQAAPSFSPVCLMMINESV